MNRERFRDRDEAGRRLAGEVRRLGLGAEGQDDVIVVGLPRGGVPVAVQVAATLHVEVDVLVARKIGAPGHPEFGVGALAEGGSPFFDGITLRRLGLSERDLDETVERERTELARRVSAYRGNRAPPALSRRVVVIVDDGLATGSTARAALRAVRAQGARRTVLAVPVGPCDVLEDMASEADDVVAVLRPTRFGAVSRFYDAFPQLDDGNVEQALAATRRE